MGWSGGMRGNPVARGVVWWHEGCGWHVGWSGGMRGNPVARGVVWWHEGYGGTRGMVASGMRGLA